MLKTNIRLTSFTLHFSGDDLTTLNLHMASKYLSDTHRKIRRDVTLQEGMVSFFLKVLQTPHFQVIICYSKEVKEHDYCLYKLSAHGAVFHLRHGCLLEGYYIFHLAWAWHHWPLTVHVWVIILQNKSSADLRWIYIHVFVVEQV